MGLFGKLFSGGSKFTATDALMPEDRFWTLVEGAKQRAKGEYQRQLVALADDLRKLKPDDIIQYDNRFHQLQVQAYTWEVWGAAYIVDDGLGDDGFSDFRGWMIMQGRAFYERTLRDPSSLIALIPVAAGTDREGAAYVGNTVFEELTGQGLPPGEPHPTEPSGTPWREDSDDLQRRYPALWAKVEEANDAVASAFEEQFEHLARPAMHVELEPAAEVTFTVGRTRFGGRPDLPEGLPWPVSASGMPMSFLLQLDLARMAEAMSGNPLPGKGTLYFFAQCHPEHMIVDHGRVDATVLHVQGGTSLMRREHPEALGEELRYNACVMQASIVQTYPDAMEASLMGHGGIYKDDDSHVDTIGMLNSGTHFFGFAEAIQATVPVAVEMVLRPQEEDGGTYVSAAEQERAVKEWRVLLQLDSEDAMGTMFGDAGYLYFMIREADLQRHDFTRVVCLMQST